MLDLQALGEELIHLPDERLGKLDLPDTLVRAIAEAKRISKHGALKRQRQYIGRLMRDVDPGPIREALAGWRNQSSAVIALQHAAERWRERLINEDDELTLFADKFPGADFSHLRQLIRNTRDERAKAKPPRAFRELYRALYEIIVDQSANSEEASSAD